MGGTQNHQSNWCNINSFSVESLQLKHEIEKQQLIIEQQKKEIDLLNQMVALMKKDDTKY
ncbi:hypothetical protein [Methylocucumis oryzae]|uniref:Uncharacterized protein n=1 Tax=Methylocucumis oryzae TaxID=1632867 RepID=A0A0F3ILT5_9GAMM|nr:hypothetical protein [Methylocucumis oryzae]KJV07493.1 hypothetical protein VZ94_04365 [Methylocucumis oryzae]